MERNIHEIQGLILKGLLLRETARFSELNTDNISSDQFTFHLKQLADQGVIEKTEEGLYKLTVSGKEYANRFDIDSEEIKIEKQAKLSVLIVATRTTDGNKEYVMQTRLKQPFFGFRGFITGKTRIGESVFDTAKRELNEETGLSASNLEHVTIYHERIFSVQKELLEDKYFFIFITEDSKGDLIGDFQGGKNEWVTEEKALDGNIFYDIKDLLALIKNRGSGLSEKDYFVEKY
ncbi:MAG: NUDIX domain-containing protein [Candidatus Colwellbacteria bacterium]|nr:NUDIX domain-containing protein [Candidatus Colwellbacteria bacterium]